MTRKPHDEVGRLGTHFRLFADMARESVPQAQDANDRMLNAYATAETMKPPESDVHLERASEEHLILARHAFSAVVFSAMALESFIYDYAASYLGDRYVKSHLDSMNLKSKWTVVPELVCGTPIPADLHAFALLGRLIKNRNTLIHWKTRPMSATAENATPPKRGGDTHDRRPVSIHGRSGTRTTRELDAIPLSSNTDKLDAATDAITSIDELARALDELDPNSSACILLGVPQTS